MRIEKCPICGLPGNLTRVFRTVGGRRFGPYPVIQHYAGYDTTMKRSRTPRQCYIRIDPAERQRITELLRKMR